MNDITRMRYLAAELRKELQAKDAHAGRTMGF